MTKEFAPRNPKDSNVYRITDGGYYTTPAGSHIFMGSLSINIKSLRD